MGGINKGWASQPHPITHDVLKALPSIPIFCIEEDPVSGLKHRLIEDYKMSGITDTLQLEDASVPQTLNAANAMARHYGLTNMKLTLLLTTVDFAQAYNHIGIDIDQEFFSYITLISGGGEPA